MLSKPKVFIVTEAGTELIEGLCGYYKRIESTRDDYSADNVYASDTQIIEDSTFYDL